MDFYLSLGGSKAGPFSIFKVGDLLETGEITPDTLAWHRDLDSWKPIREIAALEALDKIRAGTPPPPPLPEPVPVPIPTPPSPFPGNPLPAMGAEAAAPAVAMELVSKQARPFVRFWARMFDYTIVSGLVTRFSDYSQPMPQQGESIGDFYSRYMSEMEKPETLQFAVMVFVSMIAWHVLEAVLIHFFGTTPGKLLFGIRVETQEKNRVPLMTSVGRSFYVYVLGMGFHYFPLVIIGMVFSFFRLTTSGLTLWDQHLGTRVEHSALGPGRIMLAIFAFFALLTLLSVKFS